MMNKRKLQMKTDDNFPVIPLSWPGVAGRIASPVPAMDGEAAFPGGWRRSRGASRDLRLGGVPGYLREEIFTGEGLRVVRSIWRADALDMLAVRLRVENTGTAARELHTLTPIAFPGEGSLELGGGRPPGNGRLCSRNGKRTRCRRCTAWGCSARIRP